MRLLGAKSDPPGYERGTDIGELVGADPRTPDEVDNAWIVEETKDQRGSSCEGAAFWAAIMFAAAAAGVALDPSYLAMYANARELDAPPGADSLPDVGTYTYRMIEGLQTRGIVGRWRWKDNSPLTGLLPMDVLEAGSLHHLSGVYRIYDETAEELFARIEATVAKRLGVPFVMPVTDSYMRGPGGLYVPTGEPSRGDHCQCIVGYRRRRPGRPGSYKVKGSWGTWNGDGHVWVSEDVIADLGRDFSTVTAVPAVVL